jgi:(p)ppGpp synthase/HD superfamily hydrolase
MEDILDKVTTFAAAAHGDQQRKYLPEPYIGHPVRVMQTCRKYSSSVSLLSAALLHDVLEDTDVKKERIYEFLLTVMGEQEAKQTIHLVVELTDVFVKAAYPKLNRRFRKYKELKRLEQVSPDAQTIKYADIIDNVAAIATTDSDFAPVYLRECRTILEKLDKGDPVLYTEARLKVEEELQAL